MTFPAGSEPDAPGSIPDCVLSLHSSLCPVLVYIPPENKILNC